MSIIIGIDHGCCAIKTAHCSFPTGLTSCGEDEPYTRQGPLELCGCFCLQQRTAAYCAADFCLCGWAQTQKENSYGAR